MQALLRNPLVRFALFSIAACATLFSPQFLAAQDTSTPAPPNQSFKVAVYIPVSVVEHMRDRAWLESSWKQISRGVHVDKVYIETYRSRTIADDALIESVKQFFADQGVAVAGGIAYSDHDAAQFQSFCYTNPDDRAYVKHVAELTARHFDEIMLDDFFFNNTKEPSDIAAKGTQSWSDFRLKLMDQVSRELVMGPARAVNPKVKIIIKFPNWYPHFQGDGYDLAAEPKIFSGIYTGTETRDGEITDQHLQAYESYAIIRSFDNVASGRNGGGWVDTYDIRYVDRYAEQLWDTILAKAPQIMLFEWNGLLRPAPAGNREAWAGMHPSFDYASWFGDQTPDYAAVAGHALHAIDPIVGKLGKPAGVAVYRPLNSTGEDFLEDYLGEIGIPIEMFPEFPASAHTVLLTDAVKYDPQIVAKIKAHLVAGGNVVITSGLLRDLQDKLSDIGELRYSTRKFTPTAYWGAYGAGGGANLGTSAPILMPKIDFMTNDAWPLIRGTANGGGAPILLMDRYGKGILYVLAVPDNFNDLYALPAGVLTAIRSYLGEGLPALLDGPGQVSLFPYDNNTFVVESFRSEPVTVTVTIPGASKHLRNLATGEVLEAAPAPAAESATRRRATTGQPPGTRFAIALPPHSYAGFAVESSTQQ
ncbi:MAG: hypothetical protein WA294_02690 [Acidobacteriaceae bacterium]